MKTVKQKIYPLKLKFSKTIANTTYVLVYVWEKVISN